MLINAWRMLDTIKRLKAFASMQHFKSVVATSRDTWKHCATSVSGATLAESALPAGVVPRHPDSQMLNRQNARALNHFVFPLNLSMMSLASSISSADRRLRLLSCLSPPFAQPRLE